MNLNVKERITNQIQETVSAALEGIYAEDETLEFHDEAMLSDRFLRDLELGLQTDGVLCKSMDHPEAYIPYQQYVPDAIKQGIDSGALDLLGLFKHPAFGCKYVDSSFKQPGGPIDNCWIPAHMFWRSSTREFYAIYEDSDKSVLRGDRANKICMSHLWNGTSPELNDFEHLDKCRFSLPSSVMTWRTSACQKRLREMRNFTQYECPQNSLFSSPHERLSRSGLLYTTTMQLAKAFNACMFRCHGSPQEGSSTYKEYKSSCFSENEAKAVAGAIARMYNKHPAATTQLADLCYTNVDPRTLANKHPNTLLLHRHLSRLDGQDDINQSLKLLAEKREALWSDLQHIDPDAHYRFKVNKEETAQDKATKDKFVLGDPRSFPWTSPKDAKITRIVADTPGHGMDIVKEGSREVQERSYVPYVVRKKHMSQRPPVKTGAQYSPPGKRSREYWHSDSRRNNSWHNASNSGHYSGGSSRHSNRWPEPRRQSYDDREWNQVSYDRRSR
jgi:hypothetical protein